MCIICILKKNKALKVYMRGDFIWNQKKKVN